MVQDPAPDFITQQKIVKQIPRTEEAPPRITFEEPSLPDESPNSPSDTGSKYPILDKQVKSSLNGKYLKPIEEQDSNPTTSA